jgi:hypothetical protein
MILQNIGNFSPNDSVTAQKIQLNLQQHHCDKHKSIEFADNTNITTPHPTIYHIQNWLSEAFTILKTWFKINKPLHLQ